MFGRPHNVGLLSASTKIHGAIGHPAHGPANKINALSIPSMQATETSLTLLLHRAAQGERAALDAVYARVYPELQRVAHSRLRAHHDFTLLDTTSLVHECFLRLVSNAQLAIEDRRHFFSYAAATMRSIIVDLAREELAQRRGGGVRDVRLETTLLGEIGDDRTAGLQVRINDALLALEAVDEPLARLVEMRYFAGYMEEEIAELNECSVRTVRRQWDKARAFLRLHLRN